MNTILIIDDEEKIRSLMGRIMRLEGFTVLEAPNLKAGLKILDKEVVDVILCDVKLPDGSGVEFTTTVKSRFAHAEIILLTAYGNIPDGVQAMKNGAFNYITKGDDNDKIIPLLNRAMEKVRLQKRIAQLEEQVGQKYSFDNILGDSPLIQEAIILAKKVAPTDATVLLLGETGTGKEVFAQAIHKASKRTGKSFMALNCSAFSKDILESELFGHKEGAFTGATKDKRGLLEEADQGTLFLDEIGEMPVELQAKLLRVLETNEFIKVGDTKSTKVSVRIIAATNKDLQQQVTEAKFREDLFYRLNVFTIHLPSLRERKKDIPLLAAHFLKIFAQKTNARVEHLSKPYLDQLQGRDWKGNIRELKNIIERSVILADSNELTIDSLPPDNRSATNSSITDTTDMAGMERIHIRRILQQTGGNKTEAARLLNIGLTTLYRKIEEYQLS